MPQDFQCAVLVDGKAVFSVFVAMSRVFLPPLSVHVCVCVAAWRTWFMSHA